MWLKIILDSWLGKVLAVGIGAFVIFNYGIPIYDWAKPEIAFWIACLKDCNSCK